MSAQTKYLYDHLAPHFSVFQTFLYVLYVFFAYVHSLHTFLHQSQRYFEFTGGGGGEGRTIILCLQL